MSLRLKLLLPSLGVFLIIALAIHFYWLPRYIEHEDKEQLKKMQDSLRLLETALVPDLINNDFAKIHETLDRVLVNHRYWYGIHLYDNRQQRIYPLDTPLYPKGNKRLTERLRFNDRYLGELQIWVDFEGMNERHYQHIYTLEWILFAVFLFGMLMMAFFLDRWIWRPIQQISVYANQVASGDYQSMIKYSSRDEIGRLIESFQHMIKQVEEREAALINSRARHKAVIENAVDGIISINIKGIIEDFNPAAERIFGYGSDEVLGKNIKMLMPEPYQGEHDGYLQNYLTSGNKKIIGIGREVEGLRKDGALFPMELAVSDVNLGDRQLFIGITRDISERKQAEMQAKHYAGALEKLHTITSASELDLSEKFLLLLQLGKQLFNMPLAIISRVEGKTYIVEHVLSDDGSPSPGTSFPLGDTYCVHTLMSGLPTGFEHVAKSRICGHPCYRSFGLESYIGARIIVGDVCYGTINFSSPDFRTDPFDQSDYNLIQLLAQWAGNEIARVKAEEALFNDSALRLAILDSANFSIVFTNPAGDIQMFSRGAERMLGYQAVELVGKQTPMILHDPDELSERAQQHYKTPDRADLPIFGPFLINAKQQQADERKWTYIRKDGARLPVELSVTEVRTKDGESMGFLFIGNDITERQKVEKLQREFVSTVSHELRTPLTSIRGALALVIMQGDGVLEPQLMDLLTTANRNAEQLMFLINDLLDLEKINAGKLEFCPETFEITEVVKKAAKENDSYAHNHHVRLEINIDDTCLVRVHADKQRILQVLANLISNAVKYSPKDDIVTIQVIPDGEMVRVSVKDNGPGIPEYFKTRIFSPFAQADSSDTRKKGGTGLGLAISKSIIEQHNGTIGFHSELEQETEFFFELPLYK